MVEKISKILQISNGGLRYYQLVMPELQVIGEQCRPTFNPFVEEYFKTFLVYKAGQLWLFRDYAIDKFCGDVFMFAAIHYQIFGYNRLDEIIFRMMYDLTNLSNRLGSNFQIINIQNQ